MVAGSGTGEVAQEEVPRGFRPVGSFDNSPAIQRQSSFLGSVGILGVFIPKGLCRIAQG